VRGTRLNDVTTAENDKHFLFEIQNASGILDRDARDCGRPPYAAGAKRADARARRMREQT